VLNNDQVAQQRIRERAYTLWEEAGCPEGRAYEFWHRVRRLLAPSRPGESKTSSDNDRELDQAGEHSFPASDPVNRT
jgi:hypothetical protein